MESVSRTELNQQTARVLARVAAGETITITDRGRPIAQISPPLRTYWERRIAEGKITPATATGVPVIEHPLEGITYEELMADRYGDRE